MQNFNFWLANVEDRAEELPNFFIPDKKVRLGLKGGLYVKIIFEFSPEMQGNSGERLWVKVIGRGDVGYVGMLVNKPLYIPIKIGELVAFGPEHVASIVGEPDAEL